ncbi:MAG: HTTM domain-containing protein, partial [Chloroflexi bacterium]|nr:HTTM domain-containing protein [Chloroflexota bacterium]
MRKARIMIPGTIVGRALSPVSGASVATFRVVFGIIALVAIIRIFAHGWIDDLYIEPAHHFTFPGFGWVRPLPGWGMYLLFASLAVLAACIAVGYRYRICAALFFLGFTYAELIDRTTYLNHHYWMSLAALLLIFLPLNRMWAADAWRSPSLREDTVQRWVVWTLRAQVGVVYVFAGIAKLNPDWLLHAQPLRIWLYQHGDMPMLGTQLQELWVAYAMSWTGALFDLTIVGWLLWNRTRLWAYIILVVFHLITWLLFPKLGIFPWLMIAGATVFLRPDWPLHALRRLQLRWLPGPLLPGPLLADNLVADSATEDERVSIPSSWAARAIVITIAILALFHVLMPLRHFAYPGNVRWTEEGYPFAWRVMLTEKTGLVHYRVSDQNTGRTWLVTPDDYLTPLQVERMSFQPDLILQTAHIIADDFADRGYGDVSVMAESFVAWNGRPNSRLIDPDVNLAELEPGVAPKPWVLSY